LKCIAASFSRHPSFLAGSVARVSNDVTASRGDASVANYVALAREAASSTGTTIALSADTFGN